RRARGLSETGRGQGPLLAERSGAAFEQHGALAPKKTRPRGPGFESMRDEAARVRSVADLDAAIGPAVAVPEALANKAAGRGRVFHIHRSAVGRTAGGDGATDDRAADQA